MPDLKRSRYGLITVPHTGTRTLKAALDCFHIHAHSMPSSVHRVCDNKIVVSPLRDPKDVWESWKIRFGTVRQADAIGAFDEAWRALAQWDKVYDITYVPLDIPELRDKQLESIGADTSYDWSDRKGHLETLPEDPQPVEDRPLDWIYELPMVKQYYNA